MKIISYLAQKGGTGKTTTALCTGQALSRMGHRVLFVDLDPQGNLTDVLLPGSSGFTVTDVLNGSATVRETATVTQYGDIIRSDPDMDPDAITPDQLTKALKNESSQWDFCIIDNAPSLSGMTICSIYAADYLILPTQADRFGIKAVNQLLATIKATERTQGHAGAVLGVLLTRYSNREIISRQARQTLRETVKNAGSDLFQTEIRQCVSIKESQAAGMDVYTYAPKSNAAIDYRAVTAEMLERIHEKETASE